MPRIEPRDSGREASMLPLCHTAPRDGQLFMDDGESFIQSSLEVANFLSYIKQS